MPRYKKPRDSTIRLDPSGDLSLLIDAGDQQKNVLVSSAALSLASPVWRAMLNPNHGFLEAVSTDRTISWPEDNTKICLILLRICHLRFSEVPQTISLHDFLHICIFCDKYDTVTLIRPWISKWQEALMPSVIETYYEHWLFISWTIGDDITFEDIVKTLVLESESPEAGQCISSSGEALEQNMPPGIVESILVARQTALNRLLKLCYDLVDKFEPTNCHRGSDQCDSMVLGSRCLALKNAGLWPQRIDHSRITNSVKEFASHLLQFTFKVPEMAHCSPSHTSCHKTKDFTNSVQSVLAKMPSGMLKSHKTHLAAQAKK